MRLPPLEAFGRRPPSTRRRLASGRHPKPFTKADVNRTRDHRLAANAAISRRLEGEESPTMTLLI
jgi:hypothetical protein